MENTMGKNGGYVQLGIMRNLQVSMCLQHLVHRTDKKPWTIFK